MTRQPSTFPNELGIATRVGLTRGVGTGPALLSFSETEMQYRQSRLLADVSRRRRAARAAGRAAGPSRREGVSRWTTWLPFVPTHRSSPVPQSSTGCAG